MAESKRENTIHKDSIDKWLLNRRNKPGEEIMRGMQNNYKICPGTGASGASKAKYLTRAIQDQVSNSDGTFNMLRQEKPESSRNRQRYKSCK